MGIDWNIEKNTGNHQGFRVKPIENKGTERVTIKLKKEQRAYLNAYCQEFGYGMSELIRTALKEYFDRVKFEYDQGDIDDKRQLKMFD